MCDRNIHRPSAHPLLVIERASLAYALTQTPNSQGCSFQCLLCIVQSEFTGGGVRVDSTEVEDIVLALQQTIT